jgi:hypothetical protein
MAGKGGYQAPANPAPVSGPGAKSQRTDGGPADTQAAQYVSGLPFGEGQAFMNMQKSASMAGSGMMPEPAPIVPLNAPSQRPDEAVTSGADAGEGPGMSSLGLGAKDVAANAESRAIMASYVPALLNIASQPGTSPETRNIIRQLREMI